MQLYKYTAVGYESLSNSLQVSKWTLDVNKCAAELLYERRMSIRILGVKVSERYQAWYRGGLYYDKQNYNSMFRIHLTILKM